MVEIFCEYLLGNKCIVLTDNNPLSHLAISELRATEQRWASELASFDFVVQYWPGKTNQNADILSQLYSGKESSSLRVVVPELLK